MVTHAVIMENVNLDHSESVVLMSDYLSCQERMERITEQYIHADYTFSDCGSDCYELNNEQHHIRIYLDEVLFLDN